MSLSFDPKKMMGSELTKLAQASCDDQLSHIERGRLEEILLDNDQAALGFAAFMDLHAELHWIHRGQEAPVTVSNTIELEEMACETCALPLEVVEEQLAKQAQLNQESAKMRALLTEQIRRDNQQRSHASKGSHAIRNDLQSEPKEDRSKMMLSFGGVTVYRKSHQEKESQSLSKSWTRFAVAASIVGLMILSYAVSTPTRPAPVMVADQNAPVVDPWDLLDANPPSPSPQVAFVDSRPVQTNDQPVVSQAIASTHVARIISDKKEGWPEGHGDGINLEAEYYRLKKGKVKVQFNRGAVVTVHGPCDFRLLNDNAMQLAWGKMNATVNKAAKGFSVDVPNGQVVDLGTEFEVNVKENGLSSIRVDKGIVEAAVRLTNGELSKSVRLQKKQLASIDGNDRVVTTFVPVKVAGLVNTGANLRYGKLDRHWLVANVSSFERFRPRAAYLGQTGVDGLSWRGNEPGKSQWITIFPNNKMIDAGVKATYRTQFLMPRHIDPATFCIKGQYLVDDFLLAIRVNGVVVYEPDTREEDFTNFKEFQVSANFKSGHNIVEFVIRNQDYSLGGSASGLRVELSGFVMSSIFQRPVENNQQEVARQMESINQ